jgi:hypothetical protein
VTPGVLLRRLRERGYSVTTDGGVLRVSGPVPRDPIATQWLLLEHKDALIELLRVEQHPVVRDALDVFPGAWVREVRQP